MASGSVFPFFIDQRRLFSDYPNKDYNVLINLSTRTEFLLTYTSIIVAYKTRTKKYYRFFYCYAENNTLSDVRSFSLL